MEMMKLLVRIWKTFSKQMTDNNKELKAQIKDTDKKIEENNQQIEKKITKQIAEN